MVETAQALFVLVIAATACVAGSAAFFVGALAAAHGRRVLGPALVLTGVALVLAPLAGVAARGPLAPTHREISIDLTRPLDLSWAPPGSRWLGGLGSGRRIRLGGPIDLSVAMPEGRVFQGRVTHLTVTTKDGEIREVRFELPSALPPAQALDFARREAGWWSAAPVDLAEVLASIDAGRDRRSRRKSLSFARDGLEIEIAFGRGSSSKSGPTYSAAYRLRLGRAAERAPRA